MKKTIALFLITLFSLSLICGCNSSCNYGPKCYEYEDFLYSERDNGTVYLEGLSEQGKGKEVIVVPNKIDGKEVTALSYISGIGHYGELISDKLTILYVIPSLIIDASATFDNCHNLVKIVFINVEGWSSFHYYPAIDKLKIYYCSAYQDLGRNSYYANISYFYNYEGAENEGYYWVDNFDYGTEISYIPDNPTREGYEFAGWYKEPECRNKWDFEKDVLPNIEYDEDGGEIFKETALYAGWNKK